MFSTQYEWSWIVILTSLGSHSYDRFDTSLVTTTHPLHELERTELLKITRIGISWRYTEYKLNTYIVRWTIQLQIQYLQFSYASSEWVWIEILSLMMYKVQLTLVTGPLVPHEISPWLNTRVKVHVFLWTIREYPKRHFRYLSDSGGYLLTIAFGFRFCNNMAIAMPIYLFS